MPTGSCARASPAQPGRRLDSGPSDAPLAGHVARAVAAHRRVVAARAARLAAARRTQRRHRHQRHTRAAATRRRPLKADDLALRSVVDGIELGNGKLRANSSGHPHANQRVHVARREATKRTGGVLAGGEWRSRMGRRQAAGDSSTPSLTQLRASIRSDRQLTVSGEDAGQPQGHRQHRTDRQAAASISARIQMPERSRTPQLGDDVVVRNAPARAAAEARSAQRPRPARDTADREARRTSRSTWNSTWASDFRVAGQGRRHARCKAPWS
jgi:translocation and assembly module TamB